MLMMLPFEAPTIFEGIHKSYFRMPRVVKDQRSRFENDDLFRQLSHESAVKYTGFKDRPLEERQMKFIANCQEGHTEVSVVQSGSQFTLMFNPTINPAYNNEGCDFDKELGKVHIKAGFILNGVCVLWRGWIDLQRLEGFGCVEYDEYRAYLEDAMTKQSIDKQQTCNSLANNQTSIGRLNHHLGAAPLLPPQSFNPATAAAAVAAITTNSIIPPSPLGLNPACLGGGPVGSHPGSNLGPPPPQPSSQVNPAHQQQLPPVSLADSAAHYGGALAAAAAAAFHQALSIGGAGPPPPHSQSLGLPGVPPSSTLAGGSHHPLVPTQHLPYSNGNNIIQAAQRNHSPLSGGHHHNASPQHHHFLNDTQTSNSTTTNGNSSASMQHNNQTRSPERENHHHHHPQQHHPTLNTNNSNGRRQATKRAPEEMTQTDDVDVVSDINVHELDFPPRRIFKSEGLTTGHLSQKTARRAAS